MLGRLVQHMWAYCTSAVHVAGHYWVHVASLEVKKESSFRIVSLQAHQSVQNHLHTETKADLVKSVVSPYSTSLHLSLCPVEQLLTNLTTMFYRVWLSSSFQLEGDSLFLWNSVAPISWSLDSNPRRHINFPFQAKSWGPDVLFYICQLCYRDNSCRVLAPAWSSAVARAVVMETETRKATLTGFR